MCLKALEVQALILTLALRAQALALKVQALVLALASRAEALVLKV